jgi:hypothetical protein
MQSQSFMQWIHYRQRSTVLAMILATASVGVGGVRLQPQGPANPLSWTVGTAALAQNHGFTAEQIMGYAASVLEMDPPRTEAYNEIRTLLANTNHDVDTIDMTCSSTAGLNQLPRSIRSDVRTLVINYCNQASSIVQSHGLTTRQFNAITAAYPQDATLAEQIRTALIQLQQQGNSRSQNGATE